MNSHFFQWTVINIIGGFRTEVRFGYFLKEAISVHWCSRKKGVLSSHLAGASVIHLNFRCLVNTFKVDAYILHESIEKGKQ